MLPRVRRAAALIAAALLAVLAAPAIADAHEERPITFPDGTGSVPVYRTDGPYLTVCKQDDAGFQQRIAGFPADLKSRNETLYQECLTSGYRDLQAAVDAVQTPGMRILMLPGVYEEQPSRPDPAGDCANLQAPRAALGHQILSLDQQKQCPHNQNLVAVIGKKDLQIEGTGAEPGDVVLDAGYTKLNGLRGDMSNGIYLRNFTAQRTTFNAVYILATDGFVIDDVIGRWNDEYGFLTFGSDHGLYNGCEAYGNGDSGVYPGSASNINDGRGHDVPRYAIEIRGCKSHHNLLGYSGTAGDSVWVHDNEFYENSAGLSTDSAFPFHPGLPQNHLRFENNVVRSNNSDYNPYVRDGTCAKPFAERGYENGVVCPATSVPVGTGVLTAGGNVNLFQNNYVYDQDMTAFMLFWVPAFVRGEDSLGKQTDTSNDNWYKDNHLGVSPTGERLPNRRDFWWDGEGGGNCWQPDEAGSDPIPLPSCDSFLATNRVLNDPTKLFKLLHCAEFDQRARNVPASCDWFGARGTSRIEFHLGLWKGGATVAMAAVACVMLLRGRDRAKPGRLLPHIALDAVTIGSVLGVLAAYFDRPVFSPIGLVLAGAGWILFGRRWRRTGHKGLGALSWTLGVICLLDAVDRGLLMLPLVPIPPSWLQLLASAVLGLTMLGVLARRLLRKRPPADPAPVREPVAV